jgi:hypothetical protein
MPFNPLIPNAETIAAIDTKSRPIEQITIVQGETSVFFLTPRRQRLSRNTERFRP